VSLFVRLAVSLPVSLLLLRLTGGVFIRISSKRPVRAPALTVQAADRPISSFFKKIQFFDGKRVSNFSASNQHILGHSAPRRSLIIIVEEKENFYTQNLGKGKI